MASERTSLANEETWDWRGLREGDSGGGAEESGGAGWDGPGTWREPEAEEELIIGGIGSEAVTNEDEGSKDETSVLGR